LQRGDRVARCNSLAVSSLRQARLRMTLLETIRKPYRDLTDRDPRNTS
jgi:hypothetical protein